MKKLMAVLGVLMMVSSISACNTFRGAGQDIERGGEKMQDAAARKQAQ